MAKILLCDDSKLILTLFESRLADAGHEIVGKARDGVEGLELYRSLMSAGRPDLVLLDITMPNMDGRTCLDALLSLDPSATVIMVSAVSEEAVIAACIARGAKGFISKMDVKTAEDFERSVLVAIAPFVGAPKAA